MPSSPLSQTVEDLQLQLRICGSMKERASIRSAIQQLREKQDPFIRGSSIRRSRKKAKQIPVADETTNSEPTDQTVACLQSVDAENETKSTGNFVPRSSLRRSRRRLARLSPGEDKTNSNDQLIGEKEDSPQCPTTEQYSTSQNKVQDAPALEHTFQTPSVRRSRRKFNELPKDGASEMQVDVQRESSEKHFNSDEGRNEEEQRNENEEDKMPYEKGSNISQCSEKDVDKDYVPPVEIENRLDQSDEAIQENIHIPTSVAPTNYNLPPYELLSGTIETPSCGFHFDVTKDWSCGVTKGSEHLSALADEDSAPGRSHTPVEPENKLSFPERSDLNILPTSAESTASSETVKPVLSPKLIPESSGRRSRSRSPFSRFLKNKSSENFSVKKQEPKSPPPSESKESGFGKRRFSKRFRKRTSKSNSSAEAKEIAKATTDERGTTSQSSIPISSRSSGASSGDFSLRADFLPDAPPSSDTHSAKTTSSVRDHSRKQSARVVLRAIGKKLFTPKQKLPNDLEPPVKKPNSPPQTPIQCEPKSPKNLFNYAHEIKSIPRFATPSCAHPVPPSAPASFQSETKASPVWKKRKPTSVEMEVLARSQDGAPTQLQSSFNNNQERHDITVTPSVDYEAMSINELKFLLSTSSKLQEKEKIRSVIRSLLEDSDEDTATSSVNAPSKPSSSSLKRSTPVQRIASPSLEQTKPSFNVTFNNNKTATNDNRPWEPSPARKCSFRPVATPTARTTSREGFSSPPDNVLPSEEETPTKVGRSSNSRFGKREFSASVRTFRPSYQATRPPINRTESLKLHRPKDFIKAGSSPIAQPRTVRDSVSSSSNVESASSPKASEIKVAFNAVSLSTFESDSSLKQSQHPISNVTLKRSESSKENKTTVPKQSPPFIPVVRGNKRRSRGILGRVLGFKIDSDSHSFQQHTSPSKDFHTVDKSATALPEKVLDSVSEERAVSPPEKSFSKPTPSVLESSCIPKGVQLTVQTDTLCGDPFIEKSNKEEKSTDLSEVECKEEAQNLKHFVKEIQHPSEDKCDISPKDQTITDLIRELVDKTVELISLPELPSSDSLSLKRYDPEEEAISLSQDSASAKSESEDKPALCHREEAREVVTTTEKAVQAIESAVSIQESLFSDDSQLVKSCSVEICLQEESITFLDPQDFCESEEDTIIKVLQNILEEVAGSSNSSYENREVSKSSDSSLISTETSSDSSGNEVDFEDEEAMEGRYSIKNRYGGNGGSVKSRIMAKEDSSRTTATEITRLKKSRQAADLRALRNLEGVKSRMNKFATSSDSSPVANGSIHASRKTEAKNNRVNGNVNMTSEKSERLKTYEKVTDDVNNNDINKSPLSTRSKYSNDVKPRTIVSNGDVTKRIERETKVEEVSVNDSKTSDVVETTTVDLSPSIVDPPQANEVKPVNDVQDPQAEENKDESPSQDDSKEPEQIDALSNHHSSEESDDEAAKRDDKPSQLSTMKEEVVDDEFTGVPSSHLNDDVTDDVTSPSEQNSIDIVSEFTAPRSSRTKVVDGEQPPPNPLSEVDVEKAVSSETGRVTRSRRQRRSERSSTSEAAESDIMDNVEITAEKQRRDDLQLTKLESNEEVPTSGRRRRRVKKSKDLSKLSASNSETSTPDQEEKVLVTDTPLKSGSSSSASTPGSTESPVFADSITDNVDSTGREEKEIPISVGETDHVPRGDTTEQVEGREDDVTTNTAPKEAPHIKLKRIWSAPDDSQEFSGVKEEISIESESDKTTEVSYKTVEDQMDSTTTATTEDRSEDAPIEIAEKLVTETSDAEQPLKEEPVDEKVVEEQIVIEEPAAIQYTLDNVDECPDESILQGLLDKSDKYEDRKKIRAAIRALKKSRADSSGHKVKKVPTSARETGRVTRNGTTEQAKGREDDVTTNTAPKEAPHIKLKRIWSAPDDSQEFSGVKEEISIESESDKTTEVSDKTVEDQVDSTTTPTTEDRSEDAPIETAEKLVAEASDAEQPVKEEPVDEKVVEEQIVIEEPAAIQYTLDNVDECPDESILQVLLDKSDKYEDRKKIRAAIRALKRSRAEGGGSLPTQRSSQRQARATTTTDKDKSTAKTTTTKLEYKETKTTSSKWQPRTSSPLVGVKAPADAKSLAEKYALTSPTKKDMTSSSKKIGSIFDREEEAPKKTSGRLDIERRQAERKREQISRNRSMPASSSKDARKMFVAKLEGEGGGGAKTGKKVGRSPTFVVPNANNVKQMLLKWCQSKTRGYDHVDINNYSSSWANGMAFCALVHNFFPDAFDYSELDPKNRAHNFDLAFKTAEKHANADPLLEVDDMIFMGNRPDSKCVFTYVQSLYNKLRRFEIPLRPLTSVAKEKSGKNEQEASDSA